MYIIDVKISDNRFVECENIYAGGIGENNITKLKFTVPNDYKDFYKYLDIIKSDGEKTQTVIDDDKNNVFYYTLPFSLTDKEEITLQLVMKDKEKVFKSNIFVLHFNGSIEGTQKLTGDYQDTIQFIMENKASKEEVKEINDKLPFKVSKNEFYTFSIRTEEKLSKKVSDTDFLTFKNDSLNKLNLKVNKTVYEEDKENLESNILSLKNNKVDKIDGRGLSEENYTKKEKQKLAELPANEELYNEFNSLSDAMEVKLGDKVDNKTYNDKMDTFEMSVGLLAELEGENSGKIRELENRVGDIDNALDRIIEIENSLIGG